MIAAGTGVLVGASYLISPEAVRAQVLSEIRIVTGLNPTLRGETTVKLFPTGSISFDDVVLGEGGQPALTAERLTARLRFFPLLAGRVEIADVSLTRPTIVVDLGEDGRSNWSGLIDTLARSQTPNAPRAAGFSEMRITERHRGGAQQGAQRRRDVRRRGVVARLAVDLQELRRQRPLRLARRSRST